MLVIFGINNDIKLLDQSSEFEPLNLEKIKNYI